MPWRPDFTEAFWIDPDYVGLAGYPVTTEEPAPAPRPPSEAVLIMRDRIGFEYERRVNLGDFVSQRDAAKLLGLNLMTINRWVRSRKLVSRKQGGFAVVRLKDVLKVAQDEGRQLPMRYLLVMKHLDHEEREWRNHGEPMGSRYRGSP
jgi:hypothetical protein